MSHGEIQKSFLLGRSWTCIPVSCKTYHFFSNWDTHPRSSSHISFTYDFADGSQIGYPYSSIGESFSQRTWPFPAIHQSWVKTPYLWWSNPISWLAKRRNPQFFRQPQISFCYILCVWNIFTTYSSSMSPSWLVCTPTFFSALHWLTSLWISKSIP